MTSKSGLYDARFYSGQKSGSYRSARVIVPLLRALVPVKSVCDVGCGVGGWLRAFQESGTSDVQGLDGAYVDRAQLMIAPELFIPTDLSQPFSLERSFDLAISMEVAEHLLPDRAAGFVHDLTRLAPVVLFSAAVPYQGGTGHINEQWQDYWVRLFAGNGYQVFDVLRPLIWDKPEVQRFYCQNMLLFCRADHVRNCPALAAARPLLPLAIVHPRQYVLKMTDPGLRAALRLVGRSALGAVTRRLRNLTASELSQDD